MPENPTEEKPKRNKSTPPAIKIDKGSVSFNWKTLLLIIAVLGGGGGIAGINFLPKDMKVTEDEPSKLPPEHVEKHNQIDSTLSEHSETLVEQGKVIGEVKEKIDEVQSVQHKQFARDEARRATEDIRDPAKKLREYDRLVDINMKRLGRGADPCSTVNCEN